MDVGSVMVSIRANLSQFRSDLRAAYTQLTQATNSMGHDIDNLANDTGAATRRMSGYFKDVSRVVSGIMISQFFYRTINAIENASKAVFDFSNQLEVAQVKYTALLGDAQQATVYIGALQKFAASTPFDLEGVDRASQRIKLMGVETNAVLPILRTVGDAIATMGGGTEIMDRVTVAMRQMYQSPIAQKEELEQFIEAGIDGAKYLREELGLTAEQIRNLGNQGISGKTAVSAILAGLAKDTRFAGGMKKLSQTTTGMLNNIKDAAKFLGTGIFAAVLEKMKAGIKSFYNYITMLQDAFNKGGLGGMFEAMFPPSVQPVIRTIVGALQSLWQSLVRIWTATWPIVQAFGGALMGALAVVLPIIASLARAFSLLLQWMLQNKPVVQALTYAIIGLKIASLASQWILALIVMIRGLSVAGVVAQAVVMLRNAILTLTIAMTENPIVAIVMILIAVLVSLALSTKQAQQWIESLMKRLSQLAGFNMGDVLKPKEMKDYTKDLEKLNGSLGDVIGGMQDTGDAADDAKKKVDKFIASFDEVFQVPEKDAAGINAIKDFNLPKLDNTNDKNGDKNKDDGLGGFKLPDFPKNIFLPALTWPFKWSDITQPVQEFVTNLEQWLADASAAVGSWVGQVLGELGKVPAWVRGWINELGGEFGSLPGLVWNPALAGVLAFVAGVIAAFNPIGGAIALAVAAFSLFNNVPAGLQTVLDAITNWVTNLTTQLGLINTLISVWAAGLLPLIQPGLAALVLGWTGAWQNIYNSLVPVLQQIQLDWTTFWTNLQTNMNTAIPIIQAAVTVWLTNWITEWQTDLANLQTQWTTFWTNLETATNIAIPIIQAAVSGWMANWMAEWGIDLAALKANWDGFWNSLAGAMAPGLAAIKASWDAFAANWKTGWDALWDGLTKGVQKSLDWIKDMWDKHKVAIMVIVGVIALIIITILTGGLDIVIGAIGSFIAGAIEFFAGLGPAIGGVISSIPAIFTTLFSKINFGSVVSACTTAFSKLPGAISSAITRIPEIVSGIFQKAWGPISSFFGGISNFVTSMGGRGFSFSGITGFATGGIIGRDSIVRVGEGGRNEAIIPLQDGSAMAPFADAVAARLGMNSGGGQQQTPNSQQPILYVGTLIADDRSLKELNRRMQVVQLKENDRGVR